MRFVDIQEARAASGARLVVVGGVPSPWSEAAKGIFAVKGIDLLLVRASVPNDPVKQWTGSHNAPVLVVDSEPPRTHWSDILEAAERLGGKASLVPSDAAERVRMFGLAHEVLGESGLAWNGRLMAIHRGLTTEGREGFPVRVSRYLASKYGYLPDRMEAATARVVFLIAHLAELAEASRARGHHYLFGDTLTALDIYAATTVGMLAPLPETKCIGMAPAIRHAFETSAPELSSKLPAILREHRDWVYERYLGLPTEV